MESWMRLSHAKAEALLFKVLKPPTRSHRLFYSRRAKIDIKADEYKKTTKRCFAPHS
ncbi:hypothetical protein DIPPA_19481 [Diplonema papillatum]|nr:hypothetical protein DIPPA_19481 [Diplonema papillatum]